MKDGSLGKTTSSELVGLLGHSCNSVKSGPSDVQKK